jgi:poly-gamma-glutamate synthesis protein (capsule biosynthesis protein)
MWPLLALGICLAAPGELVVALGGDVQIGRYLSGKLVVHTDQAPFAQIAGLLRDADVTIINLENPVTDHEPEDVVRRPDPPAFTIRLRAPTSAATTLANAGIDIATLPNNHSLDCGPQGLRDSQTALSAAGIVAPGFAPGATLADALAPSTWTPAADSPAAALDARVHVIAATTFCNLAVPPDLGLALLQNDDDKAALLARVRQTRAAHPKDVLIVSLHWGIEWSKRPKPRHTELGHALIDAGANIVMGHHPHVLQPVEVYRGGVVFYSLGNLLFDLKKPIGLSSAVAHVALAPAAQAALGWSVASVTLFPITRDLAKPGPTPASTKAAQSLFSRLRKDTRALFRQQLDSHGDRAVLRF